MLQAYNSLSVTSETSFSFPKQGSNMDCEAHVLLPLWKSKFLLLFYFVFHCCFPPFPLFTPTQASHCLTDFVIQSMATAKNNVKGCQMWLSQSVFGWVSVVTDAAMAFASFTRDVAFQFLSCPPNPDAQARPDSGVRKICI